MFLDPYKREDATGVGSGNQAIDYKFIQNWNFSWHHGRIEKTLEPALKNEFSNVCFCILSQNVLCELQFWDFFSDIQKNQNELFLMYERERYVLLFQNHFLGDVGLYRIIYDLTKSPGQL